MKSLIEWFANNGVVANLLMFTIIILGVMAIFTVNQEIFPEFEAQMISVSVPWAVLAWSTNCMLPRQFPISNCTSRVNTCKSYRVLRPLSIWK